MQQARKHAGKVISCKSLPRDPHRPWKAVSPKGLCEIEDIDKEEMSVKMMQSLERFMRKYPAIWSESSLQHLLVEIADSQYARSEKNEAEERLRTVIMRMLVPMVSILEAEQESLSVERLKIQDATQALQRVQEECRLALPDLTKEHDQSARPIDCRDLKELGNALEENKVAANEAAKKLAKTENQTKLLLQQHQDLVIRLVHGGPAVFLAWAQEEIEARGLVDLHSQLEQAWKNPNPNPNPNHGPNNNKTLQQTTFRSTAKSTEKQDIEIFDNQFVDEEKPGVTGMIVTLVGVMVSETFQQVLESCGRVTGPFSLPSVVVGFWTGLAGRMTCLAMVTLFPQLVIPRRSSSSSSGTGNKYYP